MEIYNNLRYIYFGRMTYEKKKKKKSNIVYLVMNYYYFNFLLCLVFSI